MKKNIKLEKSKSHYTTSLSRQGYSIKKEDLSSEELEMIKENLTVQASISPKYADVSGSFPVFG